jgi:hypothetical protein
MCFKLGYVVNAGSVNKAIQLPWSFTHLGDKSKFVNHLFDDGICELANEEDGQTRRLIDIRVEVFSPRSCLTRKSLPPPLYRFDEVFP